MPTAALVAPPATLHFLLQENAAGADGAAAVLVTKRAAAGIPGRTLEKLNVRCYDDGVEP